jgi:hypothetical protein
VTQASRQATYGCAIRRPSADASAFYVTASNNDVHVVLCERLQHLGENAFVMLKVRVHDCDERCATCEHSLDASRSQAPTADALKASNAAIDVTKIADRSGGAIGGVVVYEYDFPVDANQHPIKSGGKFCDIFPLLESWNNDNEKWTTGWWLIRRSAACGPGLRWRS